MLFTFSLAVAVLFSFIASKTLRKNPWPFYILTVLICAVLAAMPKEIATGFLNDYVLNMFRRGTIGTALFVVVMYMATLKNGSTAIKTLMPVRGQLSIIASIMCLCHNIFFGRTYFIMMFVEPGNMSAIQLTAGILSIILIAIMVPLFLMSFPVIRKKMNPKKWKKIQRLAYVYYALLYVHIMVLMLPGTGHGYLEYAWNVTAYSIVFGAYAVLRLKKTKIEEGRKLLLQMAAVMIATGIVVTGWNNFLSASQSHEIEEEEEAEELFSGNIQINGQDAITELVIENGSVISVKTQKIEKPAEEASERSEEQPEMKETENTDQTDNTSQETTSGAVWKDGTYTGKGTGYNSKLLVDVDIVDGVITDIRLQPNKEDEPYRTQAMAVIDTILEKQSYEVDSISGATSTADGIITGVRRALKEAAKENEG